MESERGALLEDVCPRCAGRLLPPAATERVLVDELGLTRDMLRELAALFASLKRLSCPACAAKMSPVQVRGVRVDLCMGCGATWLDAGELMRLSGGRHEELSSSESSASSASSAASAAPSSGPAPLSSSSGRASVLLPSLAPPPLDVLRAAFQRCASMTSHDAQMLLRWPTGVVVDGVAAQVAAEVAAALQAEGVAAVAVDEAALRLPALIATNAIEVTDRVVVFGRGDAHNSVTAALSSIVAVAAGATKTSKRVVTGERLIDNGRGIPTVELDHGLKEEDERVLEVVLGAPQPLRVRVALSTMIFGDDKRGVAKTSLFRDRIDELGRGAAHAALGRGVGVWPLPKYRSLKELEREVAWLVWSSTTSASARAAAR